MAVAVSMAMRDIFLVFVVSNALYWMDHPTNIRALLRKKGKRGFN
jgi:hypothetical protein